MAKHNNTNAISKYIDTLWLLEELDLRIIDAIGHHYAIMS